MHLKTYYEGPIGFTRLPKGSLAQNDALNRLSKTAHSKVGREGKKQRKDSSCQSNQLTPEVKQEQTMC